MWQLKQNAIDRAILNWQPRRVWPSQADSSIQLYEYIDSYLLCTKNTSGKKPLLNLTYGSLLKVKKCVFGITEF